MSYLKQKVHKQSINYALQTADNLLSKFVHLEQMQLNCTTLYSYRW